MKSVRDIGESEPTKLAKRKSRTDKEADGHRPGFRIILPADAVATLDREKQGLLTERI